MLLTGIGSVKSEPKYTTMVPDEDLLLVSGGATNMSSRASILVLQRCQIRCAQALFFFYLF